MRLMKLMIQKLRPPLKTAALHFLGLLLAVSLCVFGIPLSASAGLTVTGVLLVADVTPGATLQHKITVSFPDRETATLIEVSVHPLSQDANGSFVPEPSGNAYSAAPFITLDNNSFSLSPGETREITATVAVPPSVSAGGRYAIIQVSSKPESQGSVGIGSAVNIPIFLTVAGSNLTHTGEITGLSTADPSASQSIITLISFRNTGNHHFKVRGEAIISDSTGKPLKTVYIGVSGNSILPAMTRQLPAEFIPDLPLPPGTYYVDARVMLENGVVLAQSRGSFEIKAAYTPPPPPAGIVCQPSSAATLKTDDGSILVSFPRGAVVSEAHVSLRNCPPDQLPPPPPGSAFSPPSFRLEGINGLLIKPAIITVRYPPSGPAVKDTDASRVVLGRWDETADDWVILKTRFDQKTSTLNAATNQFGMFAVMVKEARSGYAAWAYFAVIMGVFTLCLVISFIILKLKRRV